MEFLSKLAEIPIGSYAAWGTVLLIGVSGLIQISPIKIDPWSKFARTIGRAINKEVIDKVNKLEDDVATIKEVGDTRDAKEDERHARTLRRDILRFGDEIRHIPKHSKDRFDDILLAITEYEAYCDSHPAFKNRMTTSTVKLIVSVYEKCLEDDSFL